MRKITVLYAFILLTASAFGQEIDNADFYRDLNNTINNFDFSNYSYSNDGVLFLPTLYLSKKWETYATFGIMLNNMFFEKQEQDIDDVSPISVFRAAIYIKHKKTNGLLYFDYYSDYSWGLSFKIKY